MNERRRTRRRTRRARLQTSLRSPSRQARTRRNRAHRQQRRELYAAMRAMFEGDDRLVPPSWLLPALAGQVVNRPEKAFILAGPS